MKKRIALVSALLGAIVLAFAGVAMGGGTGSTTCTASLPPASGDGSVSVQRLTPTTICSPASMRRSRSVLLSTRQRFM